MATVVKEGYMLYWMTTAHLCNRKISLLCDGANLKQWVKWDSCEENWTFNENTKETVRGHCTRYTFIIPSRCCLNQFQQITPVAEIQQIRLQRSNWNNCLHFISLFGFLLILIGNFNTNNPILVIIAVLVEVT